MMSQSDRAAIVIPSSPSKCADYVASGAHKFKVEWAKQDVAAAEFGMSAFKPP
ncbi:hypothetical protein BGZ61DRAFT_441670 [Ilyonectria robusta]|uniref:uncharacterized protein n=1 Tax=Ilyonectria robusta TaxID=1079257 RepID=UPI001E8CC1C1|nr:uncharacterized protein BGZ61DRAFT_441670 [Ilyonectria robusta]KAH8736205.1 hypothetical protein BGZ61DRAFT_441670 [Ilyonectria robusta]